MMQKEDLTVLKSKSSHISNIFGMNFISARATNTRFMGVVALEGIYKDDEGNIFVYLFHLDYESYGIDGFHLFCIESPENFYEVTSQNDVERIFTSMYGGLGGHFSVIDEMQLQWLLYSAFMVDENSIECFVDLEEYKNQFYQLGEKFNHQIYYLNHRSPSDMSLSDFQKKLLSKLSPEIESYKSIINYFVMRLVGRDYETAKYFVKNNDMVLEICDAPYTLLKCISKPLDLAKGLYRVELWIDYDDKYKYMTLEIGMKDNHIVCGEIKETLELSSIEMGFALKKKEYMYVYQIKNELFERGFEYEQSFLMKTEFDNGNLYMKYNLDNSHVNHSTYYLNGDLFGLYFFTYSGQLIFVSFNKDNLDKMQDEMNELFGEDNYSYICELSAESSVINDFINSEYYSIFEFLEDGGER